MPKKINDLFKDFSQSSNLQSGIFNNFYRYNITGHYDKLRLIRFVFDEICNFKIADQPFEKINWEIPFIYKKKYNCSVAHQKFGFRIYVSEEKNKKPEKIAAEIERILLESLKGIKSIVEKYAEDALKNGDIILKNNISDLRKIYEYFKNEVAKRDKKRSKLPKTLMLANRSNIKDFKKGLIIKKEIDYLEQAGYVAFFSLLEHICVLFFSFKDTSSGKLVKEFTIKRWSDKFKTVFDLNESEFKKAYDYLTKVSRFKRNPNVHGLFDSSHTTFSFYLSPAKHMISMGLYKKEIISQWELEELSFKKTDEILDLISIHNSTKRVMKYLDCGFNISCGSEQDFSGFSDEEFDYFIERELRLVDDMTNMDW